LTKTIDPSGTISETFYDSVFRVTKTISDSGGKNIESVTMYDSLSRVTKSIDAGGFEFIVEFDQVSRVTKQTMPDGGLQIVVYDNMNNVLTKTVKVNVSSNIVYSFEYNNVYNLTKSVEDVGGLDITTTQVFDALHRLTRVTDSSSISTDYQYDEENRITKTTYADTSFVSMEFDVEGRITKKTDQNGADCIYLYDSRDLLTKKTYGGAGIQTFTWDVMRRKTQDTDNNSGNQTITMDYEFDNLSRMTKQSETIGAGTTQIVSKLYDTFGHRTRMTYPNGRNVDMTFNALHQIDLIKTDVGAGIVTVANYDYLYDSGLDKRPFIAKNTLNSGTGTKVEFGYDSMGRVTKKDWIDISGPTSLVGFEYTYDLYGNRLTDNHLHRSQDSETFLYDTAQRFTKYERGTLGGSPSFFQGYTLDDLGNWSSFNNNGSTESRTHDSVNQLTARGATSLTYDLNGNLTNDGTQKYVWDELNRLIKITDLSNVTIVDYYYNTDNLRVEKHHAGGAKEQFYYDGESVIEEQDGSQNLVREYVNGAQYIDEVILVANGSTYNYYMSDLRYCVYGFIDASGAVVERAKYDGYGKRTLRDSSYATITTPVVAQDYGYTGIRHDSESGLQYYRARYFDNTLGRFINRDPIGYVDGLNLYRGYFVPRSNDPSGLEVEWWNVGNASKWPIAKKCKDPKPFNLVADTREGVECNQNNNGMMRAMKYQTEKCWEETVVNSTIDPNGLDGNKIAENVLNLIGSLASNTAKGASMGAQAYLMTLPNNTSYGFYRRTVISSKYVSLECQCCNEGCSWVEINRETKTDKGLWRGVGNANIDDDVEVVVGGSDPQKK